MPFTIAKRFAFSAAHHLDGLPDDHPCTRPHGHNYEVEFILADMGVSAIGFVYDYRALDPVKAWIDSTLDHRDLNVVIRGLNPTAEHLAHYVFTMWEHALPQLIAVRVSETPKTWAEYRRVP
jgi:6-pyruvoyltetrahydropterin/6-carboxytetrahydropterin synthase